MERVNWVKIKNNLERLDKPDLSKKHIEQEGEILKVIDFVEVGNRIHNKYVCTAKNGRSIFFEDEVHPLTELELEVIRARSE